jgi:pyruvate-ferredoxin/flavodoxin oxidoreductase
VVQLSTTTLRALVDADAIRAHRARALDPDRPVVRGTSQNPDAYLSRRARPSSPSTRAFLRMCSTRRWRAFALTGAAIGPSTTSGHPEAERVVVLMGSGAECAHETGGAPRRAGGAGGRAEGQALSALLGRAPSRSRCPRPRRPHGARSHQGARLVGRAAPPRAHLRARRGVARGALASLPALARRALRARLEGVHAGDAEGRVRRDGARRPSPLHRGHPRRRVGLVARRTTRLRPRARRRVARLFFGLGADGTVSANKASIKIIGEETPLFAQGHFEYDSRKAGSTTISHLRFGPRPIRSTYRISRAQFIAVHDPEFLERRDVLAAAMEGATVLLNTGLAPEAVWASLPREVQERLVARAAGSS